MPFHEAPKVLYRYQVLERLSTSATSKEVWIAADLLRVGHRVVLKKIAVPRSLEQAQARLFRYLDMHLSWS